MYNKDRDLHDTKKIKDAYMRVSMADAMEAGKARLNHPKL
jgi:hypothetical protein